MSSDEIVMKTIQGHANYETDGINVEFEGLRYIKDAAVLQVSSNIYGAMTIQASTQTQSGQVAEGVNSSGNVAVAKLYHVISGAQAELDNGTSLSGVTIVAMANGF